MSNNSVEIQRAQPFKRLTLLLFGLLFKNRLRLDGFPSPDPDPANPAPSSINDAGSGTPLPGTTADTRLPTHWALSLLKQIFRSTALALNQPAPVLVNVNVTPVELYDVEPEKQVPNQVPLTVEQPTAFRLLNVPSSRYRSEGSTSANARSSAESRVAIGIFSERDALDVVHTGIAASSGARDVQEEVAT